MLVPLLRSLCLTEIHAIFGHNAKESSQSVSGFEIYFSLIRFHIGPEESMNLCTLKNK